VRRDGRRWWTASKRSETVAALGPLERYAFDLHGYLLFDEVLDRPTVARLRAAIDAQGLPPADDTIERQRFGQGGQLFCWRSWLT
jgi:hypothetical protein